MSPVHSRCSKKYKNAIVVFDGYGNINAKDMTDQKRSKGKAGAKTVTVAAIMTTTMNKDQFLANRKNKQQIIFMLSTELEKSNCKTYHAAGDANLLIVQKAVQSATTITTVLVGDDTDFTVLFCYHASLDSHDLFFSPEPKKSTKKLRIWSIRFIKEKLGQNIYDNTLFILFLGVTQHPISMGLERGHLLASSKQAVCFVSRQKYFILIQPPHKM